MADLVEATYGTAMATVAPAITVRFAVDELRAGGPSTLHARARAAT